MRVRLDMRATQRLDQTQLRFAMRGHLIGIEHVPDRVLDAVRRVSNRVANARRDRVCEQRRGDAQGRDHHRQPRASALSSRRGRPRAEW